MLPTNPAKLNDLAVVFDDVNGFSLTIGEGGDLLRAGGPAHHIVAWLWKASTKTAGWSGVIANPLVSA